MLYTECIVIEVQKKYRTQKTDLNNTIFLRKLPSYSLRLVELVVKWETCLSNMFKLINGTNNTKLQLNKINPQSLVLQKKSNATHNTQAGDGPL